MRDAMALQRRRRLMLLQSDALSSPNGPGTVVTAVDQTAFYQGSLEHDSESANLAATRDRLFQECQGRPQVQLRVEMPGVQAALQKMDRPYFLIGRDPVCDLVLDHPEIRPRHAYLQWLSGRLCWIELVDEPARSPGKSVMKPPTWLAGQTLPMGPYQLTLVDESALPATIFNPFDRSPQLAAEFPQVSLKFEGVEQSDNQWPVDRPLTLIGRGAPCKLRLDHPEMPLALASLLRTQSGCLLIDLAGRGTTRVNGRPIHFAPLDIGDSLQLGDFKVVVTAAAFATADGKPARGATTRPEKGVENLATRHYELLGELNDGLREVQSYLDAELLEDAPQLKAALEEYIRLASRHHHEMFESLQPLARSSRTPASVR